MPDLDALQALCALPDAQRLAQRVFAGQLAALQGTERTPSLRQRISFVLTLGHMTRSLEAKKAAFLDRVQAARSFAGQDVPSESVERPSQTGMRVRYIWRH